MNQHFLAAIVVVISVVALLGWVVGWPLIATWVTNGVSMKAPTAIATLWQAISSILTGQRTITARRASLVLSVMTLTLAHGSLMFRFAAMMIDGENYNLQTVDTMFHVPSVATAAALMLLALSILLYQFEARKTWAILLSQFVALTIGTSAVVGWCLGLPEMYGYVSDYSGGVALPTGVCIALLGLHGIAVTSREPAEQR